MRNVGIKPGKSREVGVRPERLAKIRNPELFKEKKMSEIPTFISSKKDKLKEEYSNQSDVIQVMSRLSAIVTATAQQDVATANSAETAEEKLVIMNQCVIKLVNTVAESSAQVSRNSLRFRFSMDLLNQMLDESNKEAEPDPEPTADEEEQEENLPEDTSEPSE